MTSWMFRRVSRKSFRLFDGHRIGAWRERSHAQLLTLVCGHSLIVLHEGNEVEAGAARYLESSPKKLGITKSQYVARCIMAAEEGGLLTVTVAQVREILRSGTTGVREYAHEEDDDEFQL